MEDFLKKAKFSSRIVANMKPKIKIDIMMQMANHIEKNRDIIIEENVKDIELGRKNSLTYALLDRLLLDEKRILSMANNIREIAILREPVGKILDGWVVPSGLKIEKVSIPIGVIGIIYESRPNVTSDTAALCFKSGNVCVLKGGKEAKNSNKIIATLLQEVLVKNSLPSEIISLLPDNSREGVAELIKMDKYVDLIIPRGGEALIKYISKNSTVPVVKHDKGLCHIFIDESSDIESAIKISINAKCQRTGVCNAMETLLVHKNIAKTILPKLKEEYDKHKTKLLGCEKTREIIDIEVANEEDFYTEYLDNILSIKIVDNLEEAIKHINIHGSGHSESILSENYSNTQKFLDEVDSACVYVNASIRFTDGG